jgi:hypothetical protein
VLSPLLQEYMGAESSSIRVSDTSVRGANLGGRPAWQTRGDGDSIRNWVAESRIGASYQCRQSSTQTKNIISADRKRGSKPKHFSFPVLHQIRIRRF